MATQIVPRMRKIGAEALSMGPQAFGLAAQAVSIAVRTSRKKIARLAIATRAMIDGRRELGFVRWRDTDSRRSIETTETNHPARPQISGTMPQAEMVPTIAPAMAAMTSAMWMSRCCEGVMPP